MNHFTFSALVTAVTVFCLGTFVYVKRKQDTTSALFFLYSLSISVWSLSVHQHGPNLSGAPAILWGRLLHVAAIMIPVLFYHFVTHFMDLYQKRKLVIYTSYGLAAVFELSLLTRYLINGTGYQSEYSYPRPGSPLYLAWFIFFISMVVLSLFELQRRIDRTDGKIQTQIKYLLYSSIIGYLGGLDNFLITINLKIYPLYPYGLYAVAFYVLVMAYAMVRHKLFDIDLIIKKVTIFAGLFGAMYLIFAIITFAGQQIFADRLGWNIWFSVVPTLVVIAFIGRPLEEWLKRVTQKYLFQKDYDESEILAHFGREVLTIIDSITILVKKTVKGLDDIIHIESIGVVLRDDISGQYKLIESRGIDNVGLEFDDNNAIIANLKAYKKPMQGAFGHKRIQQSAKLAEELKSLNSELCLPLVFENQLYGFIAFGAKKSGKSYTENDVSLLMAIASAEAIAIFNIKRVKEAKKSEAEAAQNERMLEIGGLTSGINHEIASPLTIMLGHSDLFIRNLEGKDIEQLPTDEKVRLIKQAEDILKSVQKQSEFISGITTDLSDYAKNKEIPMIEMSVSDEIKNSLELVRGILGDVVIEIKIPKTLKNIYAGRQSIRQVFTNIIKNAVQAMDHKGRLTIEAREEGDYVVTSIADTGPGIPEEMQKEIFKPFFTTKRGKGGTGLGLYLTHLLVRRNKGEMAMKSKVGEGTTFFILLRSYVGQKIHEEKDVSPKLLTGKSKKASATASRPRILTVDDQQGVVDMIQMYFESRGYEVDKALDGQRALELVKTRDYDVILLDYQMPGKEGDQVLKEIKELKPYQKVAMVTSMAGDAAIRAKLFDLGAEDCINKPLKFEDLEDRVKKFIGLKGAAKTVDTPNLKLHVQNNSISRESKNGHSKSLLVADDDQEIRDLLKMFFESKGFVVVTAGDPQETIRQAQAVQPNTILLDLKMQTPEDGLRALPSIKSSSPNSRIIMTTGNDDEKLMSKARAMGASDYVLKPLALEDLLSIIEAQPDVKEESAA